MKKLALIAIAGLVLWVGLGMAQQSDPWWDPRSPSGQSIGVTYGTNLPTLANTGFQPTDGLLAVQITPSSVPTLNMYDNTSAGWLPFVVSGGLVPDIDQGITSLVTFDPTLAALDNNNDQRNVLIIDVDHPGGTGGLVNAINIDGITEDIQTLDSAIFIEGGWDSQITFTDIGRAATGNPLTNTVWMFLSDTTDYDGGAADCAIVFRDANGGETGYIVIVSNGVCP